MYKLISEDDGTQTWCNVAEPGSDVLAWLSSFKFNKQNNANSTDAVYRQQQVGSEFTAQHDTSIHRGWEYFSRLQLQSGHWPGDYGGPMFLLPGLVVASYVTQSEFTPTEKQLMSRYMLNHQNADGGWGLHIQGPSTMFGTVMQYVALRLLGHSEELPAMIAARQWILHHGDATHVPSWGKFYLSVLGLYEWDGCNSLFPEMWLMPQSWPVHPSNYWCHSRMVYLPMAYCFGHRLTGSITPLILQMRKEIYNTTYESIHWSDARNRCAHTDLYYPQSALLKALNKALNLYEKFPVKSWRKKALDFTLAYIEAEDEQTNYINIGPVNQVINSLCIWHAYGSESAAFKKHRERWAQYLWLAEDGLKMQGYNGSQLWDTAFAYQALRESEVFHSYSQTARNALAYVDRTQVREEVAEHKKYFRHDSVGGWPFSTSPHGWPITDCTAEGLKVMLSAVEDGIYTKEEMEERLCQSCDLLLSFQNKDGGWASYELTRGPKWLEWLNPSEVFGDIMIDYSYTECSSASLQALMYFKKIFPHYRTNDVVKAVRRGIDYIIKQQRADGSWYGSWAVCFTYGGWFACEALSEYVLFADDENKEGAKNALQRAAGFLMSKQLSDGGWGESFESSVQKKYIPTPSSQVVNTAWAVLSLLKIWRVQPDDVLMQSVKRAIRFIESEQLASGDFNQTHINGVFNHNCMISYTNYRNIFPLWALGRYAQYFSLTSKS